MPDHLVVIGAGYIGLELGSVWRRLGARVTVFEYLDRILPGMDAEIAAEAQRLFERQGLEFRLGSRVTGARIEGESCVVECVDAKPLHCDRVLVAVGRRPMTTGLGLESVGITLDAQGRIPVDGRFATGVDAARGYRPPAPCGIAARPERTEFGRKAQMLSDLISKAAHGS